MKTPLKIVVVGSTGAVGGHVAVTLTSSSEVGGLTLLGRRPTEGLPEANVAQHTVDLLDPSTDCEIVADHDVAICTLGVGQPSKMSKEDFVRIDKDAVLAFATTCRDAGARHFELLSSVGVGAQSSSSYLRTTGELEDGLRALGFPRLSLFHPSMILTPKNRYGVSQALTLTVWPKLRPLLLGPLRGVRVEDLGQAMARNVFTHAQGEEILEWDDFAALAAHPWQAGPIRLGTREQRLAQRPQPLGGLVVARVVVDAHELTHRGVEVGRTRDVAVLAIHAGLTDKLV